MPFDTRGFGVALGSKPGAAPNMFTYQSQDAPAAVDTAGYFDQVREQLSVGDVIWRVTLDANGAFVSAGWHVVKDKPANNAPGIDVTDATAATATDTD